MEISNKKRFEAYIKKHFGVFTIVAGPNYDVYMVDGVKVGTWNEGTDGNKDFGLINE